MEDRVANWDKFAVHMKEYTRDQTLKNTLLKIQVKSPDLI